MSLGIFAKLHVHVSVVNRDEDSRLVGGEKLLRGNKASSNSWIDLERFKDAERAPIPRIGNELNAGRLRFHTPDAMHIRKLQTGSKGVDVSITAGFASRKKEGGLRFTAGRHGHSFRGRVALGRRADTLLLRFVELPVGQFRERWLMRFGF